MIWRNFVDKIRVAANRKALVSLFCGCLLAGGCAKWKESDSEPKPLKFPASRMLPDSVSLELAVAQLDDSQVEQIAELWSRLDQQEIPLALRKQLDANGLRVAVVPSQLPGVLRELLAPKEIDPKLLDLMQTQMYEQGLLKPAQRLISHSKIQNREGKSYDLAVTNVYPEKSWIVHSANGESAGAGKSVRGVMRIKTYPQGDGSVRLTVTPQIHHGDTRTEIGVVDRSFLFQNRQSLVEFDDLKMDVDLLPGETLICGPTSDIADLGELFFGVPGAVPGNQRIMLIRLVQTQWDDLFGWRDGSDKLISAPHE
jgi:hypothetical protein